MKAAVQAWRRRLIEALADDSGLSSIEFVFLSPVVFFLVLGTVELALDMIVDASVQIAAQSASRVGLTTTNPATGTRATEAQGIVMNALSGWQKIGATVSINTLNYGTYSNIGSSTYQSNMGAFGDVVSYQITVSLPTGFTGLPKYFGVPLPLVFQRNYLVQNEK
ncbi:TadE/TadG family type IV pilus assembly protein [Paraburkholderia sp. BCC1884]|uniref:TadE/TadG family type IV pilus assembly protein n=1 Tax=Paraburkholderia sp. BCC1884 TaxID=2562668 RepID=UPI0011825CD3|nr:TadE/TadG family type IV pilus assembly protein [Paraburkholderia sp. BCC1884]